MIIETRKVVAVAALIAATGVAAVELTRNAAQADTTPPAVSAAYVAERVDGVFAVVATMPAVPAVRVPLAQKGDLEVPVGCEGAGEAECMDVAYEIPSQPSFVVETRNGTTTTLMRMDTMTVAAGQEPALTQSE